MGLAISPYHRRSYGGTLECPQCAGGRGGLRPVPASFWRTRCHLTLEYTRNPDRLRPWPAACAGLESIMLGSGPFAESDIRAGRWASTAIRWVPATRRAASSMSAALLAGRSEAERRVGRRSARRAACDRGGAGGGRSSALKRPTWAGQAAPRRSFMAEGLVFFRRRRCGPSARGLRAGLSLPVDIPVRGFADGR